MKNDEVKQAQKYACKLRDKTILDASFFLTIGNFGGIL